MSKRKRSRRTKRNETAQVRRADEAAWSDLEQAFFAAAPPDEPGPPAEPVRFDDLISAAPRRVEMPLALSRAAAVASAVGASLQRLPRQFLGAWRSRRRTVALALGSVVVLIGFTTAVVASRSATQPRSPIAPTRPAASAGGGNWPRPLPPMRT